MARRPDWRLSEHLFVAADARRRAKAVLATLPREPYEVTRRRRELLLADLREVARRHERARRVREVSAA